MQIKHFFIDNFTKAMKNQHIKKLILKAKLYHDMYYTSNLAGKKMRGWFVKKRSNFVKYVKIALSSTLFLSSWTLRYELMLLERERKNKKARFEISMTRKKCFSYLCHM